MQILQWLLRMADEPSKESKRSVTTCSPTNKESSSEKTKEILSLNQPEASQRRKRARNISLGCENFTLFTLLRRRDISKTWFYNTLNLKRVDTMKMMKKESVARGVGISNEKGLDVSHVTADHVRNTKVLPLTDDAISSRHQGGNKEKGDQKAKTEKMKKVSKMKELVRWAAASKSEKGGKYISRKVSQNREALQSVPDNGKLSNVSPKVSFRWDVESCSISSVFSAISEASSKKITIDQTKNIHHSSNSAAVRHDNHSTPTKFGNWITTDSDFVVLEL